jgi:hypothetical protein
MKKSPTIKPAQSASGALPGALRTRQAEREIGCKKTKLFELISSGEIDSYLDGGTRMIVTASILARRQRLQQSGASANDHTREMTVRSLRARGRRKPQESQATP